MTSDLATWLMEQIAEDELAAQALLEQPAFAEFRMDHRPIQHAIREDPDPTGAVRFRLAECDAKRRIVDLHTPEGRYRDCPTCTERDYRAYRYDDDEQLWWCDTLKVLALPYADRPGYREEWRPMSATRPS